MKLAPIWVDHDLRKKFLTGSTAPIPTGGVAFMLEGGRLLDAVSDLIVVCDEDYNVVYMNAAARRMYGDGVGEKCYRLYSGLNEPCHRRGLPCSHLEIIGKNKVENLYVAQDPRGRWLEVYAYPVTCNGKRCVVEIVHDVTELKEAEERLREYSRELERMVEERTRELRKSEEKYRSLVENMADAVFTIDLEGNLSFVNLEAEKLSGYPVDRLMGMNIRKLVAPEYMSEIQRRLQARIEGVRDLPPYEFEVVNADGERIWVEMRTTPILDENGRVIGVQGMVRDVSERKRMEEKLRRLSEEVRRMNETLFQRLIEKTAQIEEACRLREKVRKTPDVTTGLIEILNSALNTLKMDVGAVLTVEGESVKPRAYISLEGGFKLDEKYSLAQGFVELEALKGMIVNRAVGEELSVLAARSVSCAPIHVGREIVGVLALGSRVGRILEEGDLPVLRLLGESASMVLELDRLRVTPVVEVASKPEPVGRLWLKSGCVYLVLNGEGVDKAFEVFISLVRRGLPGLCVTRIYPVKVRERFSLERTPVVWLSEERVNGVQTVFSLQDLSIMLWEFLEAAGRCVILIDGVEYLIVNHGFEPFIRFLQLLRGRVERYDGVVLAPVSPGALDSKHFKLLERESVILQPEGEYGEQVENVKPKA